MKKILFNLKRLWEIDGVMRDLYQMIKAGEKTIEYRDASDHWKSRLFPTPDKAWFVVGYPKGSLPRLEADITKVEHDSETGQYLIHFENVIEVTTQPSSKTKGKQWIIPEGWEQVHPDELQVDGENPNTMKKAERDALLLGLRTDGWLKPIIIDMDGLIADGQQKWELSKEHGQQFVPVRRLEINDAQRRILRQVLNKLSGTHNPILDALEYRKIVAAGLQMDLVKRLSLSENELRKALENKGPDEEPELPPLEDVETDIELGDVYQLGEHRLICGDSTDDIFLKKLMGLDLADAVFTDPPYGVEYEGGTKKQPKLIGDTNTDLYHGFLSACSPYIKDQAALYICHAGAKSRHIHRAIDENGFEVVSQIIWVKNHAQFGNMWANYKQKHEPIFYCRKQGHTQKWYGNRNEITTWNIPRAAKNEFHPTQKPVELCARAITNSTMPGMIVADFFGGSGSTLIACEQTDRKCRMIEFDPRYCQIIIDRWQAYSGGEAVKVE